MAAAAASEASARNRAATIIQTHLRGAVCRTTYARDRAAIVRAQSIVRAWLIRRRLRAAADAAVVRRRADAFDPDRRPRPGRFTVRVVRADHLKNTQILGGWKPYVWIRCGASEARTRTRPNASEVSWDETLECVVDGDETRLEVEVRKSNPMFSDAVVGKGATPLDDAYADGHARARVALVDKRGKPGAGEVTLDISFEGARRGGPSLSGRGRVSAEAHGRLHDAKREARGLEDAKLSREGGLRMDDDVGRGALLRARRDANGRTLVRGNLASDHAGPRSLLRISRETVGDSDSASDSESEPESESESGSERYASAPSTPGSVMSSASVPGTPASGVTPRSSEGERRGRGRRFLFFDSNKS